MSSPAAAEKLAVLVVDDTAVYRRILKNVVLTIDETEFVSAASNGKIALDILGQTQIDLVLLDVEMPVKDGIETLVEIRKKHPQVGVVMVSSTDKKGADTTIRALEYGALDFVAKPDGNDLNQNHDALVGRVQVIVRNFLVKRNLQKLKNTHGAPPLVDLPATETQEAADLASEPQTVAPLPSRFDLVAIGVSTGGPQALAEVLSQLPSKLATPVLIVQHMPPVFTASLARSLDRKSPLYVQEARDGELVVPGAVFIAPGGKHMVVRRIQGGKRQFEVKLTDAPPVNGCKPSVDVLFDSIATEYRGNVLAVIMTGMGEDGLDGVRKLKKVGCCCLTQDKESSVVHSMPDAIERANLSDETVSLSRLAKRISYFTTGPVL